MVDTDELVEAGRQTLSSGMNHLKPKMFFEWIEVMIEGEAGNVYSSIRTRSGEVIVLILIASG